jgi:hypothetical protein
MGPCSVQDKPLRQIAELPKKNPHDAGRRRGFDDENSLGFVLVDFFELGVHDIVGVTTGG